MQYFTLFLVLFLIVGVESVRPQNNDPWDPFPPPSGRRQREDDRIIRELMAKQQSEREKKEYAQLVERATLAEKLTSEVEKSISNNGSVTSGDREKLAEVRRLILKIRDSLGGGDSDEEDPDNASSEPKNEIDAFHKIAENIEAIVSEVKKSTRYSISVAAIESANAALRLFRFLRLKN